MKTVLITGATSGIGRATTIALAKAGHRVIATGKDSDKLNTLRDECPEIFMVTRLNVAIDDKFSGDFTQLLHSLDANDIDTIDTLFVNAGIHIEHPWDPENAGKPYEEWPHQRIRCKTLEVNYLGAMRTVDAFLAFVKRSPDGRVVFASGTLGSFFWHHHPNEKLRASLTIQHPEYSATKVALNMHMMHLARLHPELYVISLNPGWRATAVGGTGSEGLRPQPVERAIPLITKHLVGDVDRALSGVVHEGYDKITPW